MSECVPAVLECPDCGKGIPFRPPWEPNNGKGRYWCECGFKLWLKDNQPRYWREHKEGEKAEQPTPDEIAYRCKILRQFGPFRKNQFQDGHYKVRHPNEDRPRALPIPVCRTHLPYTRMARRWE